MRWRRVDAGADASAVNIPMALLSYRQVGLTLRAGGAAATAEQVRDLQRDLRRLGYLASGVDGSFKGGTELAVRALQYDLLSNGGGGRDGAAPVRIRDYNRSRVAAVSGEVDQAMVECLSDLLDDPNCQKLPSSPDPVAENRRVLAQLRTLPSTDAPTPFLLAILTQESGLKHFHEPRAGEDDTFITVGLDRNAGPPHIITSRGYGAGQYTLFHHPPSPQEVTALMLDPAKNVQGAARELREKFDHFVAGPNPGARADDRIAEIGAGPLRLCKHSPDDPRFMSDCRQCLLAAGSHQIVEDRTPLYPATPQTYTSTQYYDMQRSAAFYRRVPDRAGIGCDWPYAVRRYNGSGVNSYHYQVRILQHLASS